jgi:hypothetical protein
MNPATAATGAGGLAAAVVTVINGAFEYFTNIAPSVNFATAEITIATALAGVAAHYLTRPTIAIAPRLVVPMPPLAAPTA